MTKRYSDYTPDELNALKYEDLLRVRQAAYREHVAGMSVNPEIEIWAARMTAKHGRFVQMWANTVDWPTALLILRWGEAPEHWPAEFGEDDVRRALTWEAGTRRADGVTYLGGEK